MLNNLLTKRAQNFANRSAFNTFYLLEGKFIGKKYIFTCTHFSSLKILYRYNFDIKLFL